MTAIPLLPIGRYCLAFRASSALRLPAYTGPAWRGAFSHALKCLVCVNREPVCPPCLQDRTCIYLHLFETPPARSAGKLTQYPAAPHPYMLIPDAHGGRVDEGEFLALTVHLFGHGNRHAPYVVNALSQAGQHGLYKDYGILQLEQVTQAVGDDWPLIYAPGQDFVPLPVAMPVMPPCPERLTLHFLTPLRLSHEERLVSQNRFRFYLLFSNLLRRISMLTTFHTDTPLDADFAGLSQAARAVEFDRVRLSWDDWAHFSSRQNTLIQMGGLIGEIELSGAGLEPFWPYLWLGQWTHAGKGAVMGLGRYRIDAS